MVQQKHNLLRIVSSRRRIGIYIACFVTAVIVTVGIVNHRTVVQQLHDWKVLPETDAFTELYFMNGIVPAVTYTPGISHTAAFDVHNASNRQATYTYTITQRDEAGTHTNTLTTGMLTLAPNQQRTLLPRITPADMGTRSLITITLTTNGQHISYWLERTP
jgi:hypothetical protein